MLGIIKVDYTLNNIFTTKRKPQFRNDQVIQWQIIIFRRLITLLINHLSDIIKDNISLLDKDHNTQ